MSEKGKKFVTGVAMATMLAFSALMVPGLAAAEDVESNTTSTYVKNVLPGGCYKKIPVPKLPRSPKKWPDFPKNPPKPKYPDFPIQPQK